MYLKNVENRKVSTAGLRLESITCLSSRRISHLLRVFRFRTRGAPVGTRGNWAPIHRWAGSTTRHSHYCGLIWFGFSGRRAKFVQAPWTRAIRQISPTQFRIESLLPQLKLLSGYYRNGFRTVGLMSKVYESRAVHFFFENNYLSIQPGNNLFPTFN